MVYIGSYIEGTKQNGAVMWTLTQHVSPNLSATPTHFPILVDVVKLYFPITDIPILPLNCGPTVPVSA